MADFQYPDLLGQYVRGQMAPGQIQGQQNELQAQQQGLTEGGLRIDQLRLALQGQQMNQQVVRGAYQNAGLLPGGNGAQNPGGSPGGVQNGPQGSVGAPQGGGFTPSTGAAMGMLGFSPEQLGALALGRGDDPLKTATDLQSYQLKQKQLQAQGPLNLAESVASDPNADQIIRNNPSLQQQWVSLAPRLGLDPFKDLTPENARRVATFGYNQVAGAAGLPAKPMPDQQQTVPGALGAIYQRDPLTNKLTQVKGEEPLKDVIDSKTGLPTNMRASAAEGKQPFNQSVFAANNVDDQALQFAADTYRTTGKFPAAFGRSPALQAKVLSKVAADAAANGDSVGAIAARAGALKANGQALDQVTKLESATTSYYNTLDKNLNNLQDLAGKVDSTGSPLVNKVYRAWQQGVSGDPEVAKYVTYLNAVEGEFAKIQSGSLGNAPTSDAAKRDAKDVINKFMSQGQIQAVAEAMRGEGNNRLTSIREQRQSLMGSMGQGAPGSPQSSPQSAPTKTVTLAQVQDYAKKHNLSIEAATAHVKSSGFTVQ